jgi:hypothetical protein
VTATANSGYTFTSWTENGTEQSKSSNYNFTLATNRNLTANFAVNLITNSVTTLVYPVNAGSVNGGGPFTNGSSVTVTATANSGFTFNNWTENGTEQSKSSNYYFILATNRNLTANFTAIPATNTVTPTVNPPGAGTVSGGGSFVTGSSVTVTAVANSGFTFANWTENGIVLSTSPNYNFILAANRNLTANFTANPIFYTVTTPVNPPGAGTVSGGGSFANGTSVTVTAAANSDYTFTNWTDNGTEQSKSSIYNFILSNNRNLTANFTANPPTNPQTNSRFIVLEKKPDKIRIKDGDTGNTWFVLLTPPGIWTWTEAKGKPAGNPGTRLPTVKEVQSLFTPDSHPGDNGAQVYLDTSVFPIIRGSRCWISDGLIFSRYVDFKTKTDAKAPSDEEKYGVFLILTNAPNTTPSPR